MEALLPHPGPWVGTFPQNLNLAGTSWEVDWQVAQACSGCSWLTHAWVVFESLKEGKKQKGGIPIPRARFLEWLDSSES